MPLSIMKKLIPFIIGFVVAIQALTPPLEFSINFTHSPICFIWTFLFFGLLAICFIFTKAHRCLKFLIPYLFVNSFFSHAPHLSMTAFIWVVAGTYFYLLCLECKDWQLVFKILCGVFMLEAFLFLLQACRSDVLLNFGKEAIDCAGSGSVGNFMQFKALLILLLAFLIQDTKSFKKYIVWMYAAIISFGAYRLLFTQTWGYFLYARGAVWLETLKLSMHHPIIGWGLGTYKSIFNALVRGQFEAEGVWENAHNEPVQAFMEIGLIGIIPLILFGLYLLQIKIHRQGKWRIKITKGFDGLELLGSLMAIFVLCVYFPAHQPHTSLLLVAFVAYREQRVKEKMQWQANST